MTQDTEERIAMLEARVAILTRFMLDDLPPHRAEALIERLDHTGWTPDELERQEVQGFMLNDKRLFR